MTSLATLLYQSLRIPSFYLVVQRLAAPGAERALGQLVSEIMGGIDFRSTILDVGCGPRSWLDRKAQNVVGLDLAPRYVAAFAAGGGIGLAASASQLPFPNSIFDLTFSLGLLHHLPDPVARQVLVEMVRTTKTGGRVVVVDAVTPRDRFQVLPLALRALDRGRFVRKEEAHRALFEGLSHCESRRLRYSFTGLEAIVTELPGGLGE